MIGQTRRGWVAVAAAGTAIVLGGIGYGVAAGQPASTPGIGLSGAATDAATNAAAGAVGFDVVGLAADGTAGGPCQRTVNAAIGTLTSVNGGTLTIKTADGKTTTVTTSPSTYVVEIATGSLSDINNGDRVLVHGSTASDGTISAGQVHILPADLPNPAGPKALPARPGGQFVPNLGLAIGTVADRTASGFTVVGGDGSRVSVTTSSATGVVDATKTTVSALRVGHRVEAASVNGASNAAEVAEIDAPVRVSAPQRPSGLPQAPSRMPLRVPRPNGAGPACLPGVRLPG